MHSQHPFVALLFRVALEFITDEAYLQLETRVIFCRAGNGEITGTGKGNIMAQAYQERIKNFNTIRERHVVRELEGCKSWRHFVLHQDRGWLLKAFGKIQDQVEIVRQVSANSDDRQAFETEVKELLSMFEEGRLNYLGDEEK